MKGGQGTGDRGRGMKHFSRRLLAIDVGNTHISLGYFRSGRLISTAQWSTSRAEGVSRILLPAESAIVASVVPAATRVLKRILRRKIGKWPLVLGENVGAPIFNRYRIPSQVGQDRLVNGVAAFSLYGGPVIVVDFGTAVTIDLINGRREYLGGLIVPGIRVGMQALAERAALLPEVKLVPPKQLLGRDTQGSMRSGIFFGYSALCDEIVRRLRARYARKAKVVATGGDARRFAPYCKTVQIINPHLTLQGLELTFRLTFQ